MDDIPFIATLPCQYLLVTSTQRVVAPSSHGGYNVLDV